MIETIVKILSAIPVISGFVAKRLHGMRIISPTETEPIIYETTTVLGTCFVKPKTDWILFIQRTDQFWPHGDVIFDPTQNRWSGTVWLSPETGDQAPIILAEISPPIRYLVDHYRRVGQQTKTYIGIKMGMRPEGMKIVSRVVVRKR
jgi:hypothetical protein